MNFIWLMAGRELRHSWRRMLFFFLCIGIGVGSIIALRSTIQNVNQAIAGEARLLLTADVQVDSTRPWKEETLVAINNGSQPPLAERRVETIESPTMIRPADPAREGAMMVELKGIEPPFPLFGDFKLANGEPFTYALIAGNGAVVAPALLDRLQLQIGDEVKIGTSVFQIRGVVEREPGAGGGFRLGPRVFIERGAIDQTGLTGFGSRARRKILFRTPEGAAETLVKRLRSELKDSTINVRSYKDAQENLSEQFARAENYLSLTGLIILVLGGIGISNVTRVFIEQQQKTIAVLKCVGASGRQLLAVYLSEVIMLGIAGSLLGVFLAVVTLRLLAVYFAESLPANMSYNLQTGAVAQGFGLGLLISILFSALPLLRIRHIKPGVLLRAAADTGSASAGRRTLDSWLDYWRDPRRWLTIGIVIPSLVLLAAWQANSLRIGALFLAGLAVTAGALYAAATLLIYLLRQVRHVHSFALRQGINGLYRPGNQTRTTVMAVGLGVFLVLTIQLLQSNLVNEFDPSRRDNVPNMFLIDIQQDQAGGVAELIERTTGERPTLVPTVRARIVAVNDQDIDVSAGEMRRERGRLGREYVVTYRSHLEASESIIDGKFWDAQPAPEAEVSIEESMRGLAGMDIGSRITFDILGRKLTARVTSVRRVDWRNSRTGFLVLFRPGVLESAPQTMIGAVNGPTETAERARFQRALLDQYPNVSVIDVAEVLRTVRRILDNVTLGVSFIGGFVFLSGVLILIGSIAMTKFARIYEAAVLRTLGAKQKTLLTILLAEYSLLGLVAGVTGSLAALGLSYVVARFVFDIPWSFTPLINLIGLAMTVVLVTAVGVISSLDVLTRKPLQILRAQ